MESIESENPKGLNSEQVFSLRKKYGYNELEMGKSFKALKLFLSVLMEPMLFLLLASSFIYSFLGDIQEATVLFVSITFVIGLTFFQEYKTEKTLEKLKNLSSPRALVLRDNQLVKVPGRDVVPGDIALVYEGDRIPADALVLKEANLLVDESLITGESTSISKNIGAELISSSVVIRGDATIKILKTGKDSQIGKIGSALNDIDLKNSLLKIETKQVVKIMSLFGLTTCLAVFLLTYLKTTNFIEGILSGITIAMSMIPEEFPVILTIFLSLGAWKLSKNNVLSRRIDIIETLGAINMLCVDKTGTLTQNKMQIKRVYTLANNKLESLDESAMTNEIATLITTARLASKEITYDPMEIEIQRLAEMGVKSNSAEYTILKEYPMTSKVIATTKIIKFQDGTERVITKGAPESIIKLSKLGDEQAKAIMDYVQTMAREGFRILGVASANLQNTAIPDNQEDLPFEFLGLLGFEDPVKEGVVESLKESYKAGVNILMLTGDYMDTAKNVALKIGLKNPQMAINGTDLEDMPEDVLIKKVNEGNTVFSRVQPLQKYKLVKALIKRGDIVAMTGDGVNDSPALKEAHVGIAMGRKGTDIAREASGMVLLDDDFNSIIKGIRQGRIIYENIKKAMRYVVSIHIPIAGMAIIPVLFGLPTFFYPLHILFLEFLIDPIATFVFEGEIPDDDIMLRKPRPLKARIFDQGAIIFGLIEGMAIFFVTFFTYKISLGLYTEEIARTMAFITMVSANLGLVLIHRSYKKLIFSYIFKLNKSLLIVCAVAGTILLFILYVPQIALLFSFGRLSLQQLIIASSIGLLSIVIFDFFKLVKSRNH